MKKKIGVLCAVLAVLAVLMKADDLIDVICSNFDPYGNNSAGPVEPCAPPFRFQHGMVRYVYDDTPYIVIYGGYSRASDPLFMRNDVWRMPIPSLHNPHPRWQVLRNDWRTVTGTNWTSKQFVNTRELPPRAKFQILPEEHGFLAIGGVTFKESQAVSVVDNSILEYNVTSNSFHKLTAVLNLKERPALTVRNRTLYSFGGLTTGNVVTFYSTTSIVDMDTGTNISGTDLPYTAAELSAEYVASLNGVIIFGGSNGERVYNELYFYNVTTDKWMTPNIASAHRPSGRYEHVSAMCTGKFERIMVIVGGRNLHNFMSGVWICDMKDFPDVSWTYLTSIEIVRSPAVLCFEDVIYFSSGMSPSTGDVFNSLKSINITEVLANQKKNS